MGLYNKEPFYQGVEIKCGYFAASGDLWVKNKSNSPLEEIQIYPDVPDLIIAPVDRFSLAPFGTKHLKFPYTLKPQINVKKHNQWSGIAPEFAGVLIFLYKSAGDLCLQSCNICLPRLDSSDPASHSGHISNEQAAFYHLSSMITDFKVKALGFEVPYLLAQLRKIKTFLTGSAFRTIRDKVLSELNSIELLLTTMEEADSRQIDRRRDEIVDKIENHIDMFLMGLSQA